MDFKLFAYQIGGSGVHTYPQYETNDLNGNPPFVVASGVAPSGYEDITSINCWAQYGQTAGKDYKYIRSRIKELANASGVWDELLTSEKTTAAQWFAVDQGKRNEFFTIEQQIQLGLNFHVKSIESRQIRFLFASMEVYNRLPKNEVNEIVEEIETDHLSEQYIEYGREGTMNGDPVGLFDYLLAVSGTPYESTGAATKTLHPSGMTQGEFLSKLIDIVGEGNYP